MHGSFRLCLCVAAAALVGCDPVPRIVWDEARPLSPGDSAISDLFARADATPPSTRPASLPPTASNMCAGSLAAAADGPTAFATWWAIRPDSSAALVGSRSVDGGVTWSATFTVDSLDRGSLGCRRPPPALRAQRGQMYVAYAMHAAEGTGIFFAHWMMGMVHSPVTVLYGERVVPVALAVNDSMVAVAYEDPSSRTPLIGVAVSRSEGHAFEYHARASVGQGAATVPMVSVRRERVAVSWMVSQGGRLVRVGRLD